MTRHTTPRSALLLSLALLAGCATRMAPNQRAYVYIAENTAITFDGETFLQVNELPHRLLDAGATPDNQIVIIPQGKVPDVYLKSIVSACGRGGFPNVLIKEEAKPVSFTQKAGTGIARQPGATPPRFVAPGAKDRDSNTKTKKKSK